MDKIVVKGAREHNLKNIDVEHPARQARRHHRPLRLGQVLARLRHDLRRGPAALRRVAVGLRAAVPRADGQARRRLDRGALAGHLHRAEDDLARTRARPSAPSPRSTTTCACCSPASARPTAPNCGKPIASQTVQQIVDRVLELPEGTRFSVLAPVVRDRKGEYKKELDELRKRGLRRASTSTASCDDLGRGHQARQEQEAHHRGVRRSPRGQGRRAPAPHRLGRARAQARRGARQDLAGRREDDADMLFSEKFACVDCGISYPEITPRIFSFNSPHGACPGCDGLGAKMFFDPDLIVPNDELSLREGAIEPWEKRNAPFFQQILEARRQPLRDRHVHAVGQAPRGAAQGHPARLGQGGDRVLLRARAARATSSRRSSRASSRTSSAASRVRAPPPRGRHAAARTASRPPTRSSTAT